MKKNYGREPLQLIRKVFIRTALYIIRGVLSLQS